MEETRWHSGDEMTTRAGTLVRLPVVFGYSRIEAATAIGISATTFDKLVTNRVMPSPRMIGGRKVWDVDEIRAAFKSLPKDDDMEDDTWADVG